MTKILAMYLPQFYEIEQNNKWWGEGFTEWTNVKNSRSFFKKHRQPRVPYNMNYYCLEDAETIKWQAKIARENGIFGFCIYHYWFEGTQIMQIPPEILLMNHNIDIHYCFSWANHTWTKAPGKRNEQILIRQTYGDESDWRKHFEYLNRFFRDERYIKMDNKPVLVLYNPVDIECWKEMSQLWQKLAKDAGWQGIYYISTLKSANDIGVAEKMNLDAQFEYQPAFGLRRDGFRLDYGFWYHFKYNVLSLKLHNFVTKFNYDKVWKSIEDKEYNGNVKSFLGAFNEWDTSIRWGKKGSVMTGANPNRYENYLYHQLIKSERKGNEWLFLTAWNEWSEGAYLEPDEDYGYEYLKATKKAVNRLKGFNTNGK